MGIIQANAEEGQIIMNNFYQEMEGLEIKSIKQQNCPRSDFSQGLNGDSEGEGLMRMEMSILQTLDWRTKQTLPFRFVPYFLHFLTLPRGFTRLPVHKIIVWTQADIRFTKFRPSTVAASALLCALVKLFQDDSNDFTSVILSRYAHMDCKIKDELAECVEMICRTYENKMNTLVMDKGLINDGVGTIQPLNLAHGEASIGLILESGKESVEEGSHKHGKETVAEEATEGNEGIETMIEKS